MHAHGVIQIVPAEPRRLRSGEFSLRTKVKIAREGLEAARLDAGADKMHHAMKVASGNATGDRPAIYKGRSQERNVWWRKMLFPFFNVEWISYSFKNTMSASGSLPENRLCMSRELNREAQRLWTLIRDGDAEGDPLRMASQHSSSSSRSIMAALVASRSLLVPSDFVTTTLPNAVWTSAGTGLRSCHMAEPGRLTM